VRFVIVSSRRNRQRKPPNTADPGRQRWGMSNMIGPYAISTLFLCIALCVLELWKNFGSCVTHVAGLFSRGYGDGTISTGRGIRASTPPRRELSTTFLPFPPTFMIHYVDSLLSSSQFELSFSYQWRFTSLTTSIPLLTHLSRYFHPHQSFPSQVTCRRLRMRH